MQITIPDNLIEFVVGLVLGLVLAIAFFIFKGLLKKKVNLENIKEIIINLDKQSSESNNNLKLLSNNVKLITDENNKLKKILEALENAKR